MAKAKESRKTKVPVVTTELSRCPKCKSTDRERYYKTKELAICGKTADGKEYTHVKWRRTRCVNCGQCRTDRCLEYRTGSNVGKTATA